MLPRDLERRVVVVYVSWFALQGETDGFGASLAFLGAPSFGAHVLQVANGLSLLRAPTRHDDVRREEDVFAHPSLAADLAPAIKVDCVF